MPQTYLYSFLSVVVISLASLAGLFVISLKEEKLKKIVLLLVAFSAGTLLGDTFIHILPEAAETFSIDIMVSLSFLLGMLAFFVLEKFLAWRHCHVFDCEQHPNRLGAMNLVGDSLHNLIDGMLIGGSFLININLGFATSLAVLFHEIPQEMGDFGILIHSGYSRSRALLYNLFSALTAAAGLIIVLLLSVKVGDLTKFLLPFTGGSFLYIAASGIIPELHKETRIIKSLVQFLAILLGIGVMLGLTLL